MDEIAIQVDKVGKVFKSAFVNFYRHKKGYELQKALNDVSFEVKKGEFFGIVGRNGSGKSTLLKLLAGIYMPTSGTIEVRGKLTPFIELGVGFNPELTGRENVFLNGALLGFNRKEMQAMYKDIVKFAELEKFMDQKLKNYSSGMQVRLAFSIAIRAQSDILLIDEVLAVGDQSFQEKCFRYFAELKKTNRTVVFVTHDMSNVERFCDRVLLIDKSMVDNGIYTVKEAILKYNQLNHLDEQTDGSAKVKSKRTKIQIAKIELLDKDGKPRSNFLQGEPLDIKVHLKSGKGVESAEPITIGLAFHDSDGVNIAGPNSLGHNLRLSDGPITYRISKLPFNMGRYELTAAVFDKSASEQYDLWNRSVSFFVNTENVRYGKVVLEDEWRK